MLGIESMTSIQWHCIGYNWNLWDYERWQWERGTAKHKFGVRGWWWWWWYCKNQR